ncbi:hypothetical protein RB195_016201 [Necator americanus]|uniref:G protein-coupled receptor n=1 Tax=Necator americanus TaxID=51031 RepID=A0ABR1E820_NECAM
MWLCLFVILVELVSPTLLERTPTYLDFIAIYADDAVVPCVFKVINEIILVQPVRFTATPLLWIIVVTAFTYSRHRYRMIKAETSQYQRIFFVEEWFEKQRVEEKERGVHAIDATLRDPTFRYDDVKVTKAEFRALRRRIEILPHHRYNGFSPLIYIPYSFHIIIATISFLICIVTSLTVIHHAVLREIHLGAAVPNICTIAFTIKKASVESGVLPATNDEPRLCNFGKPFTVERLDERKEEIINFVSRAYLSSTNNAVTRITSMLLVLSLFSCMFHMWIVAFVKSTFRRTSCVISIPHPTCFLATERHTQLVTFMLPLAIFICILVENAINYNETRCT